VSRHSQKRHSEISRFCRRLRSIGLSGIIADSWCCSYNRFTDCRLGIDTGGCIDNGPGEQRHEYLATDYAIPTKALRLLANAEEEIVFLDYGCGKGRTLATAAMRPFKRVIGVELDDGLLAIARKNLARLGNRVRCGSVSLHKVDAPQFEVPDDVNAVFMFNAFSGDVMTAVIDQLKASLHRRPAASRCSFTFLPTTK